MAAEPGTPFVNEDAVEAAAQILSPIVDKKLSVADEDTELLNEIARSLPSQTVKDLLSVGLCIRCIFRLLGIQEHVFYGSPLVLLLLRRTIFGEHLKDNEDIKDLCEYKEVEVEPKFCCICLGILQFIYLDGKGVLVKEKNAISFSESIAELIMQEGHEIDGFSLEVSLPPIIQDYEHAVRLYMERKYSSELWFQQIVSKCISTKDALKFAITDNLEKFLDVKSGPSSFHIRLTYTQAKPLEVAPDSVEGSKGSKRRKTGANVALESVNGKLTHVSSDLFDIPTTKGIDLSKGSVMHPENNSECIIFPKDKVNEPCNLSVHCYRTAIYFGGRYLKFSRNVSQTRWIIDDERMGEASVEEIIGDSILPICQGDSYKFHAAGREDIDVRMLGSGRPFLVEIQNARQVPSETIVKELEAKINNINNKLVGVKNLRKISDQGWTLMHEGEAEKQKQYCALVWISRPLEDQDLQSITSIKDMKILQKTPVRVLHRRSPLEREKIIHWMKIERLTKSCQYFLLHLCTQAGTYIKEFVHGDLGRTHPSVGSILGCRAEILQLDVTAVIMDCFLDD